MNEIALPREYQQAALAAIERSRSSGKPVSLIEMATGLGKSYVLAWAVQNDIAQGKRILVNAHTIGILRTIENEFRTVLGNDVSFGRLYEGKRPKPSDQVVFATLQSMRPRLSEFRPTEFAVHIVDESHHAQAVTYKRVIDYFRPEHRIGATATPNRKDGLEIQEIFGPPVYQYRLEQAIADDKWLARVDYRMLFDHKVGSHDLDQITTETQLNSLFATAKTDDYLGGAFNQYMIDAIEKQIESSSITEPRILFFGPSVAFGEQFAADMRERQWNAAAIHSVTSVLRPEDRATLNSSFTYGSMTAATTVDAYNEGVNVPQANVVIFARSTQSQTVLLQQLGRGLRRIPSVKEEVLVLDFAGSVYRYDMIAAIQRDVQKRSVAGSAEQPALRNPRQSPFRFSAFTPDVLDVIAASRGVVESEQTFERNIKAAEQFRAREGHLVVPVLHVETLDGQEIRLGKVVTKARSRFVSETLSPGRVSAWNDLGMVWQPFDERFQRNLQAAAQFREREGHLLVPQKHVEIFEGREVHLGAAVTQARWEARRGQLPPRRLEAWGDVGIVWDGKSERFQLKIRAAKQFRSRKGHLSVPPSHIEIVESEEVRLGRVILQTRKSFVAGRLLPEHVNAWDKLGIVWDPQSQKAEQNLRAAKQFFKREGHLRPGPSYVEILDGDSVKLGSIVASLRTRKKNLSPETVTTWEEIGMVWAPRLSDVPRMSSTSQTSKGPEQSR